MMSYQSEQSGRISISALTYLIKVEWKLARHRAVESCFQERRPALGMIVGSTAIVLADATHTRIDRLAKVHVLHGQFTEEEQHEAVAFNGAHKVWLIELLEIVLLGAQILAIDQWIPAREIGNRGAVQLAIGKHIGAIVGGTVRAETLSLHISRYLVQHAVAAARSCTRLSSLCTLLHGGVVTTARLIRIGAAEQNLAIGQSGEHTQIVVTIPFVFALQHAQLTIGARAAPLQSAGLLQSPQCDIVDDVPAKRR